VRLRLRFARALAATLAAGAITIAIASATWGIGPDPSPNPSPDPGSATAGTPTVTEPYHVPGSPGRAPGRPTATRPLTQEERNLQTIYTALCSTYRQAQGTVLPFCQTSPTAGAPANPGRDIAIALRTQLRVVMPPLRTAPPPGTSAVTGIPVWLWVDPSAARPVSQSATFGPLSVSITATATGIDWDTGDGHHLHCDGTGTPYVAGQTDPSSTPTCSYAYTQRSTVDDPNGTYTLRGSMTWQVSWRASTGEGGTLPPLRVAASMPIKVEDLQPVLD
jgi:hypothetical protein